MATPSYAVKPPQEVQETSTAAKVVVGAGIATGVLGVLAAAFGGGPKKPQLRGARRVPAKSCNTPCGR